MLKVIVAPLLGGVIGYITNDLAIKMLFHPHKPVYIGKWHVPFTPGLIPSQKDRIAKSLGGVISTQLLNAETIRREALSDANREKLRTTLLDWLQTQAASTLTVRETLAGFVPAEKLADYKVRAVDAASAYILTKLKEAGIGGLVTAQVTESIRARLQPLGFAHFIDSGILDGLSASLAETIDAKVAEKAPKLLHEKLAEIVAGALDKRVCDAAQPYVEKLPALVDKVMALYESVLVNHLQSLLNAARLDVIIENKISGFDAAELEWLVFSLMKRELNAIIYLGAALGFLMGFINLLL